MERDVIGDGFRSQLVFIQPMGFNSTEILRYNRLFIGWQLDPPLRAGPHPGHRPGSPEGAFLVILEALPVPEMPRCVQGPPHTTERPS